MIVVLKGFGGTVAWYPRDADGNPRRPDSGPTVEVLSSTGSALVAAGTAATLDTVNTTLSAGAAAGITTLSVASATGIVRGTRYVLSDPYEEVEVSRVSGTTVYLTGPTWYGHGSGAAFQGHRVSYALTGAQAATEDDSCRALFSWALSSVSQARGQVDFAVARSLPTCPVSPVDLLRADPDLRRKLASTVDVNLLIQSAFDEVLEDLSAGGLWSYDYIGSERLKRAVVYKTLHLCSEHYGRAYQDERDRLWDRYRQTLATFRSVASVDDDRDGAVGATETNRAVRTFTIVRA